MEAVVLFIVKGAKVTIMWIQFTWTHLHLPTRIYVEQSVTYGGLASLVVFDPSPKRDALLCLKCDEIVWVNSCATTHYTPVSISSMCFTMGVDNLIIALCLRICSDRISERVGMN